MKALVYDPHRLQREVPPGPQLIDWYDHTPGQWGEKHWGLRHVYRRLGGYTLAVIVEFDSMKEALVALAEIMENSDRDSSFSKLLEKCGTNIGLMKISTDSHWESVRKISKKSATAESKQAADELLKELGI